MQAVNDMLLVVAAYFAAGVFIAWMGWLSREKR